MRLENDPTPAPAVTPYPAPTATPRQENRYAPPQPQQQQPVPYVPPRGPAPPIETVYPALTPYAGASTGGNQPAAPGYGRPTPTPRPVLGPEDVEPEERKRGGIVRGLFRAIPFVGGDDDDDEEVQQTPAPMEDDQGMQPGAPIYRGIETPEIISPGRMSGDGIPLLLPPGSTPLPGDPEPTSPAMRDYLEGNSPVSPPILTPEPRIPQPVEDPVDLDSRSPSFAGDEPAGATEPVLTIKRESDVDTITDTPTTAPGAAPAGATDADAPRPAETPLPLERATTSVVIQESRPRAASDDTSPLGPQPDASATRVDAFDPTESSNSSVVEPPPVTADAPDDEITSLTLEQSDLGMPNPAYEQNAAVLAEFQGAVRMARDGDHESAAKAFRDYAANHPKSGLAPRAAFLSIIFEKSRSAALSNFEKLEETFPDSRYVAEAEKRRGDELEKARSPFGEAGSAVAAGTDADPFSPAGAGVSVEVAAESRRQQINRLEKELTEAVGDPVREPVLRKRLGELYIEQEEFGRAYEILLPAAEMAQGQNVNGEILLALGRAMIGRGETIQAIGLFEAVEEKNPGLIESSPENTWAVALAHEGAGRFARARSLYSLLRQKYPASREAGWATARLNELAALHR